MVLDVVYITSKLKKERSKVCLHHHQRLYKHYKADAFHDEIFIIYTK